MDDHTLPEPFSPTSPSWRSELAVAALTGVVTTYLPVQRWPRAGQWALHGGMGALAAGATGWFISRPDVRDDPDGSTSSTPPPPAFTAAVALLAGLLVAGGSRGGQSADAWMERRLAARGVRRPRMWLGLAAAGVSLAMSAADRRREDAPAQTSPGSVGAGG